MMFVKIYLFWKKIMKSLKYGVRHSLLVKRSIVKNTIIIFGEEKARIKLGKDWIQRNH